MQQKDDYVFSGSISISCRIVAVSGLTSASAIDGAGIGDGVVVVVIVVVVVVEAATAANGKAELCIELAVEKAVSAEFTNSITYFEGDVVITLSIILTKCYVVACSI